MGEDVYRFGYRWVVRGPIETVFAIVGDARTFKDWFTVFKQVPYMDGQIVSGWNFRANEDKPFQQYCYFSRRSNEPKGQVEIKIDLAMDGKVLPQPVKSDVNLAILASNCVWFDGKSL